MKIPICYVVGAVCLAVLGFAALSKNINDQASRYQVGDCVILQPAESWQTAYISKIHEVGKAHYRVSLWLNGHWSAPDGSLHFDVASLPLPCPEEQ